MTSVQQDIHIAGNQLFIDGFQTDNYDIVSYFENLNESADLSVQLEQILKAGTLVMKSVGSMGNVNYVEKAFDNLHEKMKHKFETTFGDEGQFAEIIQDHFGEDGKIIKEIFDPDREGSPLYSIRSDVNNAFLEIFKHLNVSEGKKEGIEKSTQKGRTFEDECEEKLAEIAAAHSDILERTGTERGSISANKKGDFVLTVSDLDKKIVFEMKNMGSKLSLPAIQKQLDEGMENRGAEYGILVVKKKSALPKGVGWFNEYDGNKLICAIENDDGDSLFDKEIIHIAYKWARAKLKVESTKTSELDPSFIEAKADAIQGKLKEIKKIKTHCKNIEDSAQMIKDTAKNTEKAIKNEVDAIIESL